MKTRDRAIVVTSLALVATLLLSAIAWAQGGDAGALLEQIIGNPPAGGSDFGFNGPVTLVDIGVMDDWGAEAAYLVVQDASGQQYLFVASPEYYGTQWADAGYFSFNPDGTLAGPNAVISGYEGMDLVYEWYGGGTLTVPLGAFWWAVPLNSAWPGTPSGTPMPPGTPQPTPPGGTPPPTPPPAEPIDCPQDVIQQQAPQALVVSTYPPNPVVVGQGGYGLDITVRVTSYPVVRHWWTEESEEQTGCVHVETGFVSPTGQECVAQWPGWEYQTVLVQWCEEHVEVIPDPIQMDALRGHARLRENSRTWIETTLARRYPGARVRHPDWDITAQGTPLLMPDRRVVVQTTLHFACEDPGYYDLWVDGWTVGTAYTPPRPYRYERPQPQPVYLMDSTLIPDW